MTFDIFNLTFDMTEGTDSTSTDAHDIGTIHNLIFTDGFR